MIAEIPREKNFDLPEGRFKAHISNLTPQIKQAGSGPQDWVRISFGVTVPRLSERYDTMAGRNFKWDFNPGSDLRNFLSGLLGKEWFAQRSGQNVCFDSLVGMECEVELEHKQGEGYDKPLVLVTNIRPASSSIKPEKEVAEKGKD